MFGAQTGRFGLPFAFRIAAADQNCAPAFCHRRASLKPTSAKLPPPR
jgi:hypothetical protein